MSVKDALDKYSAKQLPRRPGKKRKYKKPEKITEKECLDWMREHGFSVHIVESKAVYNASAGRYLSGQTIVGFSDCVGCDPDGVGVFVEFKARDRRSTLRDGQREFLREKILKNAFACVVDTVKCLEETYLEWVRLKRLGLDERVAYLLDQLPKTKLVQDSKDFF